MVAPLVWSGRRARRASSGTSRRCAAGCVEHIPAHEAERQLKLGAGGLRDVEFAVQLLQLVHGRADADAAAAHHAERAGRADPRRLRRARGRRGAARRLRVPAHRSSTGSSCTQLRRTHVVPEDEDALRRLGRSMGFTKDPVAELDKEWRAPPPRGAAAAREAVLPAAAARGRADPGRRRPGCRPEAARAAARRARLPDPKARAAPPRGADQPGSRGPRPIQRTLLPVMLEWFADAPDPDAGLFGFRRISEALGSTHWYLRRSATRARSPSGWRRLLATSRYATDLLEREPQGVRMLGDDLAPLSAGGARRPRCCAAGRPAGRPPRTPSAAIRAVRRRELFRIAVGDLLGEIDVADGRRRALPADRRHARGDARRRRASRCAAQRDLDAAADPDGDRRDGPLRRVRAVLRQSTPT